MTVGLKKIIDFLQAYAPNIFRTSFLFLGVFIYGLFFVGQPYLSLLMILCCFIFYSWYYIRPHIESKFFLSINIFIGTIYVFIETDILIIFLFAVKFILFLLIIHTFMSLFNKKHISFMKDSVILFGLYLLLLAIYVCIIKIYFLKALSILAAMPETLLLDDIPSRIFFSFQNVLFFNSYENPLFLIDFSNESQLSNLTIELSKFDTTKKLFFYLTQMIKLSTGTHLNLVFIII